MWMKRLLILFLLSTSVVCALANPRSFPPNTLRGVLAGGNFPQVQINGVTQTLAPGAKIMSRQNTIIMSTTLMSNQYIVNYTVDTQGYINKIWILTDEELAQPLPQQ